MVTNFPLRLNNYEFKADYHVVNMGDLDIVLGMTWLHSLEEVTFKLMDMEIKFEVDGKQHILRAIKNGDIRTISLRRMERVARHDDIRWAVVCTFMPIQEG